ncbi:MAG: hypothetical protein PVH12_05300 [Candidatus Bathyarchaeota archaeon]|jgi:hypothetical protein
MMDECRKGWALRYLREAKAELKAARKMPYIAPSLVLEAARKARNAIHYSLGEPAFIENIIHETNGTTQMIGDPVLRCLVEIEDTVQQLMHSEDVDGETAMEQVVHLVQLASEVVETITGEKMKD